MKCFKPFVLKPSRHRFGLTLVELLVVIGIIAVLAGIIWVVLSPIRERAYIAHCVNNLKQVHLALDIYRQDYDGREAVVGQRAEYWELGLPFDSMLLKPYAKTTSLYCPLYHRSILIPSPLYEIDLWMAGYMWAVWEGKALGNVGPDWADVIAKRGEEFPISLDQNHNPDGDKEIPWRFGIVLRLNGSIETKKVWVLGLAGSHEW